MTKKKAKIPILILLVAAILITIIMLNRFYTKNYKRFKEIDELNQNSNLPFELSDLHSECDASKLDEKGAEYGYYYVDEYLSRYHFNGFPDLSCTDKFTGFSTTRTDFDILGIKVGMDINEAIQILLEYRYKESNSPYDNNDYKYKKGKIEISLYTGHNKSIIEEMRVKLNATDYYRNGNYK